MRCSLARSIDHCGRTAESANELQTTGNIHIQQQLRDLTTIFNAGCAGAQQIMDLREAKATVRERLQATEVALAANRQRALDLENKENDNVQRISSLELELVKAQGRGSDSPQMMVRFQEVSTCNAELKDRVAASRQEVSELSRQLKGESEEHHKLDLWVENLERKLAEARAEVQKLADERSSFEAKALAEGDLLRQQLSQAASLEEARLESQYQNEIQQLRQLKMAAENEAKESKRHMDMLQVEKDVVESEARERLQAIKELETHKNQEVYVVSKCEAENCRSLLVLDRRI